MERNIQCWRTKSTQVIQEFEKRNMDILVISETKKKGNGAKDINETLHFWNGVKKETKAQSGVGILIKKKWGVCMSFFYVMCLPSPPHKPVASECKFVYLCVRGYLTFRIRFKLISMTNSYILVLYNR